jgi:hypothetical protein
LRKTKEQDERYYNNNKDHDLRLFAKKENVRRVFELKEPNLEEIVSRFARGFTPTAKDAHGMKKKKKCIIKLIDTIYNNKRRNLDHDTGSRHRRPRTTKLGEVKVKILHLIGVRLTIDIQSNIIGDAFVST